jgi:rare lipoprotein A
MKRWLIILCLVIVHDSAIAATSRHYSNVPLWKQIVAVFSPARAHERHAFRRHGRVAQRSAPTTPPVAPSAAEASAAYERHAARHRVHVDQRAAAPTTPAEPPTIALAAAEPSTAEPATSVPPAAEPPAAEPPAPEPPAIPPRAGGASAGCSGGQRIVSAYYWEGRHTASGQPFNPQGLTAAHRTLPFGTRLTVTNPRTGRSVTVTINDRGPFVRGVSLDLSLGAAQAIGMHGTGVVCIL